MVYLQVIGDKSIYIVHSSHLHNCARHMVLLAGIHLSM